ncbi:hypothetical protein P3T27_003204 [Kitasatospora sp. MAA19]|uniref:hypothetical protein n=1 Tax=Kitasatospora sp. MAA19 TaxID=3035090 RepID=UPI002474BC24|nr:hypothetical protein [Kitasatospora sp. MAA19]MDH6706481.1 hypothetical protein [Kitasatospora sp. MAA19]
MTTPTMGTPAAALRAVLQLYPEYYRRERGEEMAAVFADTTAEANRSTVAREVFDLALYGLRVRLGLTGSSMGGRVLALAAPMAAGALAGAGLLPWVTDPDQAAWRLTWDHSYNTYAMTIAPPVLALLLGVAALLGRWTAVRVITGIQALFALATLAKAAVVPGFFDVWWVGYTGMTTLPAVAAALLLFAAPTELLPRAGWRAAGLVLASVVGGGALVALLRWDDSSFPLDVQWFVVLLIAPVLLTFSALRGRVAPAAVGVAMLSLTTFAGLFNVWRTSGGISMTLLMSVPVVLLLVAAAKAVRRIGTGGGVGGGTGGGVGGDAEGGSGSGRSLA